MVTVVAGQFPRTLMALESDDGRLVRSLLYAALLLLAAWTAWLLLGSVTVYAVSESARLEAASAPHRVDAPVGGRVAESQLTLGRAVSAGELLLRLDDESLLLEISERRERRAALLAELGPLEEQVRLKEQQVRDRGAVAAAVSAEALQKEREALATASLAEADLRRAAALAERQVLARVRVEQLAHELEARRAAAGAARAVVGRIDAERRESISALEAEAGELRERLAKLAGDAATESAAITRAHHDLDQLRIVAPVAGRLGEIASVNVGSVVASGTTVATVVPPGPLQVASDFAPAAALGKIEAGQPARLRLKGFPWTQYGFVPARVVRVGEEAREGAIRVELDIDPGTVTPPLQHGLPGTVEIEIERTSPALLLLRAAGAISGASASRRG